MQIFAIDKGSDRKISLHSIENVVQLQADELQTCVQALETVKAIVRDARKLKNILSSLELSTARYRRLRAEERIPCIVDNWDWYCDWPSGRLFQLFLLPTPDFRFIVDDVSRRNFAKDKFPERTIPQAFLKLLREREAELLINKMNVDEETRPGAGERNAGETTTPPPSSNELKNQASILEPTSLEDADVMHAMLGDNDVQYSIELPVSENNGLWTGSGTQSALQEGNWIPWNYN